MPERKLPPNFPPKINMDKRRREMIQIRNRNRFINLVPPPPPIPQVVGVAFIPEEINAFPVPLIPFPNI